VLRSSRSTKERTLNGQRTDTCRLSEARMKKSKSAQAVFASECTGSGMAVTLACRGAEVMTFISRQS